MNRLSGRSKLFIKKHASTILTGLGAVGVVTTSVMAVKATPKALSLVEQSKKEKGEDLTKLEVIRTAAPVYIPSIMVGAATITCIFGANLLNKRTQASLMSAYALIDNAYKEYRGKLIELYGEETDVEIRDAIAVEKSKDVYMHAACFTSNCDLSVEDYSSETKLFYEEYGQRYFESTIEQVISAEYHFNRNYVLRGYAPLNELYEFLGLESTDYGSEVGWSMCDEVYWVDFDHRKIVTDDGRECYVIDTKWPPTIDDEDEY